MDGACPTGMNESCDSLYADGSTFLTELEVLQEICEEEIAYNKKPNSAEVCITLHPATAGNKDAQFVCLTLVILVTSEYPDVPANFQFRNPRGLSEDEIERISGDLKMLAEEKRGSEMMYDLIQTAKDSLTENNSPSLPCTICQCQFEESEVFTKTSCYHYFHNFCLAKLLQHSVENEEEEPKCPVCREALEDTLLEKLQDAPEPNYDDCPDMEITPELRQWQEEMKVGFDRQKAKGGHIDIEAESNKHLISIRHVPNVSIEDMVSQQLRSSSPSATAAIAAKTSQDNSKSAASHPENKPRDGKPVFVHDKHHIRRGGHDSHHRGSRGHGEGRGHHRSHPRGPRHSGRDERQGSSRGHQKSDPKRTGDRDKQVERRGNNGQKEGERRGERLSKVKQSNESKEECADSDKVIKQKEEETSDQLKSKFERRNSGGQAPSISESKETMEGHLKGVDEKDLLKKRDAAGEEREAKVSSEAETKKLKDGEIEQERTSTGKDTRGKENQGGNDMKAIRNREYRHNYHHRNYDNRKDGHRSDHGQNRRRPARSNYSDGGSLREDSVERQGEDPRSGYKERGGRRGRGQGSAMGGARRGGSARDMGRGADRAGSGGVQKELDGYQRRVDEAGLKAGSASKKEEEHSVRPPPGFNQKPVVNVQKCKPPPGFEFR
ncbi:E3 ubiquitin-protein ligase RNF25-like [Lytechinus variegatus]|uniref:E3 ubiquitin-protein ligase RNF25-like n=1 Tax=Lytechinus variegatus TaxID=7654 RepID=UPI001BB1DE55|nr:E3 ubiquitin-protein ligase RNF25-like [Lytechinus variegatus]